MIYDLQKASVLKRISAWLLDFILIVIVITGMAWMLSEITGFDKHTGMIETVEAEYAEKNGISFELTEEEYNAKSEEERKKIDEVYEAFTKDERVTYAFNMMFNLILLISSLSIFFAFFIMEFIIPLILKNGQTVGKKVFAIGVMQSNGVRLSGVSLFARSILGKCTVETMVPIVIIAMILFGVINIVGIIVLLLILIFELVLVISTKTNSMIHDIFAFTVTVDLPSQMIFDTEADLIEYKKRIHNDIVNDTKY